MSKITAIKRQKNNPERLNIYIDGYFCTGVRERTFKAMDLSVGDEITCNELKEKENFFWKESYKDTWVREKEKIAKVEQIIQTIDENIMIHHTGFGTDSTDVINHHPDEKGIPDISISNRATPDKIIMRIEITGTREIKGNGYWVRPDKIAYSTNHPTEDVWIILHYEEPEELFIFLKPNPNKVYMKHIISIRGADEMFCIFNAHNDEVKSLEYFSEYLRKKLYE